jgi:RimJ/RimL family protein N-acetyltransferase
MDIHPIILTGKVVRLEPLTEAHVYPLAEAGSDASIWAYMRYGVVDTPQKMRRLVEYLLALQTKGSDLPFAVHYLADSKPVGMTRFMDIQPTNRALEIGGTWYAAAYQRTAVNTECKYLLMRHAFEDLGMLRVQFKTDLRNERSQRAIERIGAVREGVLRNHILLPDGSMRSSVFYSVLAEEWPYIKARLEAMLERQV